MSKKVAVVLSGCGFLDGAEIRESVLTLLALSEAGVEVQCFAPSKNQHHTVNHLNGKEEGSPRNILEESARIARGEINDLSNLRAEDYDALIFPGGYGVAKNLCTFAFKGAGAEVDTVVEKATRDFYNAKKPIGAICIAPALMALLFGKDGVELTVGEDAETAAEIEKTGAKHIKCPVSEFVVDKNHKIATTAAYMYADAPLFQVRQGIQKCVNAVVEMA